MIILTKNGLKYLRKVVRVFNLINKDIYCGEVDTKLKEAGKMVYEFPDIGSITIQTNNIGYTLFISFHREHGKKRLTVLRWASSECEFSPFPTTLDVAEFLECKIRIINDYLENYLIYSQNHPIKFKFYYLTAKIKELLQW